MKKRGLIIVASVLVVLGAAFALLNFRFISSQTKTNSMAASVLGGTAQADGSITPQMTGLFVEGRGMLKDAVQSRVKRLIQNQAAIGEVRDLDAVADQMDISVLYVKTTPEKFFWTPFYARATYHAVVAYSTNGDLSFRDQEAPHFKTSGDQPILQIRATLDLTDTSFGVMSLPGYEDYLAGKLAVGVVESLRTQMNMLPPAVGND